MPGDFNSLNAFGAGGGITTVQSWSGRPLNPDDGDLFKIDGTNQIYRASGGSWTQGWYPEVNDISNANAGNVDGELIRTQTEGPYRWSGNRSEWVHAGIELVSSWGNRPSNPDDGDLIEITSTGQIYKASGGSFVEGFHPTVSTIGNADDGNIDGEVVFTNDKGAYSWQNNQAVWAQPSPPVEKMDATPVDHYINQVLLENGHPQLTDVSTKPSFESASVQSTSQRMIEHPRIEQSAINQPRFDSASSVENSLRLDPHPTRRNSTEQSNKIGVDSGYSTV